MEFEIVAWDNGFVAEKIVTGCSSDQQLIFPSITYESEIASEDSIFAVSGGGQFSEDNLAVIFEGTEYLIGNNAIKNSPMGGTRNFSREKYQDPSEIAKLLAGVALLAQKEEDIVINTLIVGANINDYRELKEDIAGFYTDQGFRYRLPFNEKVKTLKINNAKCIPQGIGSFYSEILDDDGEPKKSSLLNQRYGLLDIGGKTTDAFIAEKTDTIKDSEIGLQIGTSDAFVEVGREMGIPNNLIEFSYINEDYNITYNRQKNRIKDPCEQALKRLSKQIIDTIEVEWARHLERLDLILLCGGGARSVKDYMIDSFNGIRIEMVEKPQLSNALGYYKLGLFEKKNV